MVPTAPPQSEQAIPDVLATPDRPVSPHTLVFAVPPILLATNGNCNVTLSLALHSDKPISTVAILEKVACANLLRREAIPFRLGSTVVNDADPRLRRSNGAALSGDETLTLLLALGDLPIPVQIEVVAS